MGILGGIGFTMSIFIANLAFVDSRLIENSKMAILTASVTAALIGFLVLSGARKVGV
jgi:Na+:H+ antiporter, NhaA family